jgi:hypothetical protein
MGACCRRTRQGQRSRRRSAQHPPREAARGRVRGVAAACKDAARSVCFRHIPPVAAALGFSGRSIRASALRAYPPMCRGRVGVCCPGCQSVCESYTRVRAYV